MLIELDSYNTNTSISELDEMNTADTSKDTYACCVEFITLIVILLLLITDTSYAQGTTCSNCVIENTEVAQCVGKYTNSLKDSLWICYYYSFRSEVKIGDIVHDTVKDFNNLDVYVSNRMYSKTLYSMGKVVNQIKFNINGDTNYFSSLNPWQEIVKNYSNINQDSCLKVIFESRRCIQNNKVDTSIVEKSYTLDGQLKNKKVLINHFLISEFIYEGKTLRYRYNSKLKKGNYLYESFIFNNSGQVVEKNKGIKNYNNVVLRNKQKVFRTDIEK